AGGRGAGPLVIDKEPIMKRTHCYVLGAGLLAAAVGVQAEPPALESTARAMLAGHVACGSPVAYSGLQKRLLEHAAQGVDQLRNYVYITRGIYQLNMTDIGDWMDDWRQAQAHCTVSLAQDKLKR
ncbi:MAG TPA: hypothetical protein VFV25_05320, partial [Methylibium sp.]